MKNSILKNLKGTYSRFYCKCLYVPIHLSIIVFFLPITETPTFSESGLGAEGGHEVNQAPPPLPTFQEGKTGSTKP